MSHATTQKYSTLRPGVTHSFVYCNLHDSQRYTQLRREHFQKGHTTHITVYRLIDKTGQSGIQHVSAFCTFTVLTWEKQWIHYFLHSNAFKHFLGRGWPQLCTNAHSHQSVDTSTSLHSNSQLTSFHSLAPQTPPPSYGVPIHPSWSWSFADWASVGSGLSSPSTQKGDSEKKTWRLGSKWFQLKRPMV